MVLMELGGNISRALKRMTDATVVDEKVLAYCLNEIARALLQADVRFAAVRDLQNNIRRTVDLEALAAGTNKCKIIQQAVYGELCSMLDPGSRPSCLPKESPAWSCSSGCRALEKPLPVPRMHTIIGRRDLILHWLVLIHSELVLLIT